MSGKAKVFAGYGRHSQALMREPQITCEPGRRIRPPSNRSRLSLDNADVFA